MPSKAKSRVKAPVEYRGKLTRTGNSQGFRFESAFFKSHPEFSGNVTARVLRRGEVLIVAEEPEHEDPILDAYFEFLARDMKAHPERVRPLNEKQWARIGKLVEGIEVNLDEDLGEEDLLS
jgi:hypothetical protein